MEDARASTMEGFSHLTPPFALLTPWLWAEDDGGGHSREGCLGGSARRGRERVAAGLCERLLACLEGWPPPCFSLQFNKAFGNDTIEKLLQGTCSLVYSWGLCHLTCEMAGCEYVSGRFLAVQMLSLSGQRCGGWAPEEARSPAGQFPPRAVGSGPLISLSHVRMEENPVNLEGLNKSLLNR